VIPNLAAGGYRIVVNAPGYVIQTYGAKTVGVGSSARGTVISLAPGQSVREITVRLTAASTISGRVTSSNGIPLSGMDVHALRVAYDSSGSKTLVSDSGSQTDDRGEYRLTGMAPGRYYVRAETRTSPQIKTKYCRGWDGLRSPAASMRRHTIQGPVILRQPLP